MDQFTSTDHLAAALKKAGFRLTQSTVLNVRTGERWLHQRVIRSIREVDDPTPPIFAKNSHFSGMI